MENVPPKWTNRGDGFYVKFDEEEELPLADIGIIDNGVIRARCTETEEIVVVKRVRPPQDRTTPTELEVEILRFFKHYHCIRTLGCYMRGDECCIITQPLAVCDLHNYLSGSSSAAAKRMSAMSGPREKLLPKIMGCLAHTLQYIHKVPPEQHEWDGDPKVRHRDITPSNILLDGPRVLLADFGLSKVYTRSQTGTSGPSFNTPMVMTL